MSAGFYGLLIIPFDAVTFLDLPGGATEDENDDSALAGVRPLQGESPNAATSPTLARVQTPTPLCILPSS